MGSKIMPVGQSDMFKLQYHIIIIRQKGTFLPQNNPINLYWSCVILLKDRFFPSKKRKKVITLKKNPINLDLSKEIDLETRLTKKYIW